MKAHEVYSQGPELLESVYQLPKTPCKSVVAIDHNSVYQPPAAIGYQTVQRRPMLLCTAGPCVHELTGNLPAPPTAVTVPDILIPALQSWREYCASAGHEALIFPSETGGPMRHDNWLRRRLKPVAKAAGITERVNFRVLRRTFATNAQGHGNPKDVQAHLRHTDIGTTLNEYTQSIPESVRQLVNSVANDVMGSSERVGPQALSRVQ